MVPEFVVKQVPDFLYLCRKPIRTAYKPRIRFMAWVKSRAFFVHLHRNHFRYLHYTTPVVRCETRPGFIFAGMADFKPFPAFSVLIGIIYHLSDETPLNRKFAEIKDLFVVVR